MPFVNNQGVRIHYETEGAGPPLVLQHWSVATLDNWADFGYVTALKNDYRLILLDTRGHGSSDKPQNPEAYELKKRVEDILAILDELGIEKTHFFGYSMGGAIGFSMAQIAPERLRSLIIGGAHPYASNMEGLRQFIQVAIEEGPEVFVNNWEDEYGKLPPELRKRMLAYDYETLMMVAQDRDSMEAILPTMEMPCLLYAGELDNYQQVQECARLIPNATFFTLPGLDHGSAGFRSDIVVPHLKKFLAKVERETGKQP